MKLFSYYKKEKKEDNIIAAMDIGAHKVAVAVFKINFDQEKYQKTKKSLECVASTIQQSKGLKSGSIASLDDLEESVLNALHSVEQTARYSIREIDVSIPSSFLQSSFLKKNVNLSNSSVNEDVLKKVLYDPNYSKELPENHDILHIHPISYDLDDIKNIQDPRKMVGNHLTAHLHVITVPKSLINNISFLFSRYDLKVRNFIASPFAVILGINDLGETGTVIDIGYETTNIICYSNGNLVFHYSMNFGGLNLTDKISQTLGISFENAERLKIYHGYLSTNVEVQKEAVGYQNFSKKDQTVYANNSIRVEIDGWLNTLGRVLSELNPEYTKNLFITGGTAQLNGLVEYMQIFFKKKIHIASPDDGIKGNTSFTACLGAIRYAYYDYCNKKYTESVLKKQGVWKKLKNWFNEDL